MVDKNKYLTNYKIDESNSFILIDISSADEESQFIIPLKFINYDFSQVDICIDILLEPFKNIIKSSKNINTIIKKCFKDCNNLIDKNGNLINLSTLKWIDDVDDTDDNSDELLRVFVKTLKKNTMEVCSNSGDYYLICKKKIYKYDKDKMNLNLSNLENLKDTKHLYGSRLIDQTTYTFYDDNDTCNFSSIIPCSDSDENTNKDTETENKISALKKLCGILKNMNDSSTPKSTNRYKKESNYNDVSSFINNSDINNSESNSDSESEINIQSLREKIKRINSNKKTKTKTKTKTKKKVKEEDFAEEQEDEDSDSDSEEQEDETDKDDSKRDIKSDPSQMQQLILYFLTNPDSLPKLIDSIHSTIDNFTDHLNPTAIFNRQRPLRLEKYFSNVNLVLKYIEMLKIIELKYKQTLEFKISCDDFELETEAKYFNDHLNKIWDMVKLIICELSALKLNKFSCSVPQCGDVKFDSSDLFIRNNKDYQKILQKIGFATNTDGTIKNASIILDQECSKILLIDTILKHQRMMLYAYRKYMETPYSNLKTAISTGTTNNADTIAIWNALNAAIVAGKTLIDVRDAGTYAGGNDGTVLGNLQVALAKVTTFKMSNLITYFEKIVDKAYNFTNVKLFETSHYALEIYYGPNFNEENTSIKTDSTLGALYVLNQVSLDATMKTLITNVFKNILAAKKSDFKTATGTGTGTGTVDLNTIRASACCSNLSECFQDSSYNPLTYNNTSTLTNIAIDANGNGQVIRSEYDTALDHIWPSGANTKSKYYELLHITYKTQSEFQTSMTEKSDKNVLVERRKKLINFLKQLENDTNLSLSFFGEMASSYNTTIDSNVLNAPPDVFNNLFGNHGNHQHQSSYHNHRGAPAPAAAPSGPDTGFQFPFASNARNVKEESPKSGSVNNDILDDSDEAYDETTDEESDSGFKLKSSPKSSVNSFRKTYTGSKKNYL